MAKSQLHKDLEHQISLCQQQLDTIQQNPASAQIEDATVLANAAFILNGINTARKVLAKIPSKNWIVDKGNGPTFIPLVRQVNRLIQDFNKILSHNPCLVSNKKRLNSAREELINRLKGSTDISPKKINKTNFGW